MNVVMAQMKELEYKIYCFSHDWVDDGRDDFDTVKVGILDVFWVACCTLEFNVFSDLARKRFEDITGRILPAITWSFLDKCKLVDMYEDGTWLEVQLRDSGTPVFCLTLSKERPVYFQYKG